MLFALYSLQMNVYHLQFLLGPDETLSSTIVFCCPALTLGMITHRDICVCNLHLTLWVYICRILMPMGDSSQ